MDLEDYSGEFNLNLKLTDFSKEALVRLAGIIAKDYLGQDGMWLSVVREKLGWEVAKKLHGELWIGPEFQATRVEMRRLLSAFNIRGNDVATVFKYLQLSPQIGPYYFELDFDLKNKSYGIITVKRCPGLDYFHRHDKQDEAEWACVGLDTVWFPTMAGCFNSKIKVRPLTELPRKTKSGIACQWEFKLVE